jgi:hypothetical protein
MFDGASISWRDGPSMRGYKAAMNAALGRGSQALTEWIDSI